MLGVGCWLVCPCLRVVCGNLFDLCLMSASLRDLYVLVLKWGCHLAELTVLHMVLKSPCGRWLTLVVVRFLCLNRHHSLSDYVRNRAHATYFEFFSEMPFFG